MSASKPTIGLLGGIGSGKSSVARCFAELGARVIEADKLGHEALRQPETKEQVARRWPEVIDATGEVDRTRLATIVFVDPKERKALEELVHPWIERRMREEIDKAEADLSVTMTVLDAAILVEAGWDRNCDSLIYVDAPREERLKRVAAQRGWSEKEVLARENAQLPVEEKEARADFVVDNSGDPAQTRKQVEQFVSRSRIRQNSG